MLQKLLYLSANVLILGLAMWKLRSMGLLPTAQSDWVEFIEARNVRKFLQHEPGWMGHWT